jgi:hypothetical protein
MMVDDRAWIVRSWPTPAQHPRHHIDVFADEESPRPKSIIESINRLKGFPAAGKIGAVNQTRWEKISGMEVFSRRLFLDCDPVILWIVEKNPPTYEPQSGLFFEAARDLQEEVLGRVTIIVRESNDLSLRNRHCPVMRPSQPRERFNDRFYQQAFPETVDYILRFIL